MNPLIPASPTDFTTTPRIKPILKCSLLNFKTAGNPYLEKKRFKFHNAIRLESSNLTIRSKTPMKVPPTNRLYLNHSDASRTLTLLYHAFRFEVLLDSHSLVFSGEWKPHSEFCEILKKVTTLKTFQTSICTSLQSLGGNIAFKLINSLHKIKLQDFELSIKPSNQHDQALMPNTARLLKSLKTLQKLSFHLDLSLNGDDTTYIEQMVGVAQEIAKMKSLESLKLEIFRQTLTQEQVDNILHALTESKIADLELNISGEVTIESPNMKADLSELKNLKRIKLDLTSWTLKAPLDLGIQKIECLESYTIDLASEENASSMLLLPTDNSCYKRDTVKHFGLSLNSPKRKYPNFPIFLYIGEFINLESLKLSLRVNDLAILELSGSLKKMNRLKSLTLDLLNSKISESSLAKFFKGLCSLTNLKSLTLQVPNCSYISTQSFSCFADYLNNAHQLRNLALSSNLMYVHETALIKFAQALRNLSCLSSLHIDFEYIYSVSNKVLTEMGNSLMTTKTLEEFQLKLIDKQDRYIDKLYCYFQYKWLSDSGLRELFKNVSKIPSLRRLRIELDSQLFSDNVLISIGESFKDTKMLKELVIRASNCRNVNYVGITKYISSFIKLEKLELDLIKLSNSFGPCPLWEAVEKLPYLSTDTCKIILNSYFTWFNLFY